MSAVAAQTDRRFRRAHVKPARRRRGWRGGGEAAADRGRRDGRSSTYGGYRATLLAAHAHVLQVEKITVRGNERLSKGEVLAVLNGLRGENLCLTDLDRWRTRLTRLAVGARRGAAPIAALDDRSGRSRSASRSASAGSTATCIWSTSAA